MGQPMATSQDFVNWVCSENIDQRFLALLFLAQGKNLLNFASGATHQTIYYPEVKAFHVCIPPLPKQKQIVSILDEIFKGIERATANAERNLANARDLFVSYLNSVFTQKGMGWAKRPVGDLAKHSLGKMLDKRKNRGELKPYLRNLNVRWFGFDLSDTLEMRFEPEEYEKYTANRGDLLICEGGYPGRAAIMG